MSLLRVENVSKRFGSLIAVSDVSLTVEPGELRAVIGPNGAGKTTFFNLISGFLTPTSGRIIFDGEDVTHLSAGAARLARHGAHISDHRSLSRTERVRKSADRGRSRLWLSAAHASVAGRKDQVRPAPRNCSRSAA